MSMLRIAAGRFAAKQLNWVHNERPWNQFQVTALFQPGYLIEVDALAIGD